MFWRKSRNSLVGELLFRSSERIADRKDTRVEYTDDIASAGFVYDLSLARHHLLRLRQPDVFASLHMVYTHSRVELSGTDTHKSDPVPVRLVHIRLNLEYKGGKILFFHRVDLTVIRHSRKGRSRHGKEVFQEGLYAEIGQRRPEKYRGELSLVHQFLVKTPLKPRPAVRSLLPESLSPRFRSASPPPDY